MNVFDKIKDGFQKNGSEILTGFGIGSFILSTVWAVKETPEALRRLKERRKKKGKDLTTVEEIKTAAPCYIPAATAAVIGASCVIGGSVMKGKQNAMLATTAATALSGMKEYKDKVVEVVGQKKEQEIRDEIVKDKIEKNPPPAAMVEENPEGVWGTTTFYDVASGRYFKSDLETLRRAANKLNHQLNTGFGLSISLNEWYVEIGLEPIYPTGEAVGWNVDGGLIEIHTIEHRRANGTYVTGVTFKVPPQYEYDKL